MHRNEGTLDRLARAALALGAAAWALVIGASVAGVILWIVAAILALTALTGFCPAYRAFKLNTRRATN